MITLYDIATKSADRPFSSNTWKARFVLNYKRIPYRTVYLPYADIRPTLEGFKSPPYTVPTISVPQEDGTLKYISESYAIAEYLEHKFPETPRVFPPGSRAVQACFVDQIIRLVLTPLRPIVIPQVPKNALDSETSAAAFRVIQEAKYGKKLEDLFPEREKQDQIWKELKGNLDLLDSYFRKNETGGEWIMGNDLCFADFVLGGAFIWLDRAGPHGEDGGWDVVKEWNGGRWKNFMDNLKVYMQAD